MPRKVKALPVLSRVCFSYQKYPLAIWFGSATIISFDITCNMYTVQRDEAMLGSIPAAGEPCREQERWPHRQLRPALLQPSVVPRLAVLPPVRPGDVRALVELGYRLGVHFCVPAAFPVPVRR